MLQIQKPKEHLIGLLGKQEYNRNIEYRPLYFCITMPVEDGTLLFNNLTKELVLLTDEELKQFESSRNILNDKTIETLVNSWFLVPLNNDDMLLCEQLRKFVGFLNQTKGITYYTILPTTACNARCFYCFEAGISFISMDDKTADAVVDYIERNSKGQKVTLNWFGGEPLCNYRIIDRICGMLKERDIEFQSRMDSNSYLFDKNIIDRAVDVWNLKLVHVTIDGMPETYNKVKNYINNDSNAFEHVTENIRLLCQAGIPVLVRMNMDFHNADELFSLVDLLHKKFIQYKNFNLYATPLYEGPAYATKRTDAERIKLTKQISDITQYIAEKGFKGRYIDVNGFYYYACQADKKDYVVIVPDGHLAYCEHYISNDFFGTVYEDVEKPFWSDYRKPDDECKTCPAMPNCRFLEKCPSSGGVCYNYYQFTRINAIKSNVKKLYKRFLKTQSDV